MTKLIVVILISDNIESHHALKLQKKLRVTVEPEGPHEVPEPLAVPKVTEVLDS